VLASREARFYRGPASAHSLNVDAWKRLRYRQARDTGAPLLPSEGEDAHRGAALVARLRRLGRRPALEQRLAKLEAFDRPAEGIGVQKQRTPYLFGLSA
jgi:indolepyruvate ferredoxin oxidoreductase